MNHIMNSDDSFAVSKNINLKSSGFVQRFVIF